MHFCVIFSLPLIISQLPLFTTCDPLERSAPWCSLGTNHLINRCFALNSLPWKKIFLVSMEIKYFKMVILLVVEVCRGHGNEPFASAEICTSEKDTQTL